MNRLLSVLTAVLWGAGCAFQETPEALVPASPALTLAVDWSNEPSPELGKRVKATRSLLEQSKATFSTQEYVTLPVDAPKTLYLAVEMPAGALPEPIEFVRSRLHLSDGRTFQVVASFVAMESPADEKRRVIVQIAGLNALLLSDRTQEGALELRFYSRSTLLSEATIRLRTPPSRLELSSLTLRDWYRGKNESDLALERPEVMGRKLNLLRVIRIKNSGKIRIEVQLPRHPQAALKQWINPLVHQDTGCGYQVNESPRWDVYSESVLFLPLDSEILTRAAEVLSKPALNDRIPLRVEPESIAEVGVYGVGQGVDHWMNRGPAGPELVQIRVQSDCYRVCVSTWCSEGPCHHCDKRVEMPPWIEGSSGDPTVLGCHCDAWEERRHDATITVGVNRGPVLLDLSTAAATWPVRFADLDFSMDGEARSTSFIPMSSEVLWK